MRRPTQPWFAARVSLAACAFSFVAVTMPPVIAAKPADLPGSLIERRASESFAKKPKKAKKTGKKTDSDEPKADKKAGGAAKKLAQQAAKHEKKGRYDKARDAYRQALELDDAAKYRVRLAVVEAQLGNLLEAAQMLRDVESSSNAGAADKKNAEAERAAIEERTPKLELALPSGFSGSVSVDGEELDSGSRKSPLALNPGSHRVHAEADGYLAFDENLELKEGESKKLSVELEAERSDEAPAPADEPVAEKKPASGSSSRTLGIIGLGVGVVGAGVGTYFALRSRSTRDELDGACPNDVCPEAQREKFDEGKRDADIATAAFIVGGVGLGAGLVLLLTAPSEKEKPTSARLAPLIGPRSVGLQGRF